MYRTAYQSGKLTIFFSCGSKPLEIWEVVVKDGYIKQFLDQELKSMVLDIRGNNVSTTYMVCPSKRRILGISMPFLIMVVKNLKKYFSFEVTILDDTGTRRRFRVSNFQSTTQIMPLCTAMPIGLTDGWNQIQFNLAEFTRRAYNKQFVEVQQVKINANIRVRRIYFTQKLVPDEELPPEYKLFFPLTDKRDSLKKHKPDKENIPPADTNKEDIEEIKPATKIEPVDSKDSKLKEIKTESKEIKTSRQSLRSIRGSKAQLPTSEVKEIKPNSRQSFQSIRGSKAQLPTVTDPVELNASAIQDVTARGESNAAVSVVTVIPSLHETLGDMVGGPSTETAEQPQVKTVEETQIETVEETQIETAEELQVKTVEEKVTIVEERYSAVLNADPGYQPIDETGIEEPLADTIYDPLDVTENETAQAIIEEQYDLPNA